MTAPIVPGDLFARCQIINGLRSLADFLDANPDVPINEFGWSVSVHPQGTPEEKHAEVDRVAALLKVAPTDETASGGHYIAMRTFGRITYQAVQIPKRRMDEHQALMSYRSAFETGTPA